MTDYKNELRSVLYDFLGDFKEKRYLSEGNTDEAIAKLEALLSQHSKKRELEAETKLLEHLATSDPRYTHAAVMDELGNLKYELNLLEGKHTDIPGFEGTLEQLDKLGVKK